LAVVVVAIVVIRVPLEEVHVLSLGIMIGSSCYCMDIIVTSGSW